jgi:hypothetical protein
MTLEAVPACLAVAAFGSVLAWLLASRTYIVVALLWLIIPMAWRLASAFFIDLSGPVYAQQVMQHIGPGHATALLALDYVVVLGVFALVLPRDFSGATAQARLPHSVEHWKLVSNAIFIAGVVLLAATYADMLRIGSVPLFSGIERYDYARDHAGYLHGLLFRFGDVIALALGCLFVLPSCFGRAPALRFLGLLLAMLAYAFLTGHRYSAFFKFCTLFALPCALLFTVRGASGRRIFRDIPYLLPVLAVVVVAAAAMVLYAVIKSYFTVRFDDADDPLTSLKLRLLIQQGELWWLTYHRVIELGIWDFNRAFDFLFRLPINPNSNTSVQYVMYLALGKDAIPLLDAKQQFAGGFPEIPHEMFGGVGGVLAVGVLSLIPAMLLRLLLGNITQGRILTALWAGLVLYPFAIMYWGGMLNFVLTWTFWLKLAGLAAALVLTHWRWLSWTLRPTPAA